MLSSIILYEASKKIDANVYIMLWGSNNPLVLAKPGDDQHTIQQNIIKGRSGLNSGTDLAPGIVKIAKTIGEQRGKSGTLSGFTHVLIISDGDMFDAEKAKANIMTMFEY